MKTGRRRQRDPKCDLHILANWKLFQSMELRLFYRAELVHKIKTDNAEEKKKYTL